MRSDKELLELAAKAAGLRISNRLTDGGLMVMSKTRPSPHKWNPLTDDGDAFRLAVKLNLLVGTYSGCATVWYKVDHLTEQGDDPYAATRRAITRADAEIGAAL